MHGNADDVVALVARQAAEALTLRADDDRGRAVERRFVQVYRAVGLRAEQPDAALFKLIEGGGEVVALCTPT